MMTKTKFAGSALGSRRQGGAALVVGLVLLMILTLLAISGMNIDVISVK